MYYEAEVYKNGMVRNRFIANTIEVLKIKSRPFIENDNVEKIVVREVKEIGFFKVQDEFKKYVEML